MNRTYHAAISLGLTLVVYGTTDRLCQIQAATHDDLVCVTMLNPSTCKNEGNSYCNWKAGPGGGGVCNGKCVFCDSSTSIPNRSCVFSEDSQCDDNGGTSPSCSTANQKKGGCNISGSCLCANLSTGAPCGGSAGWPCN